jgi:hypothetical protein
MEAAGALIALCGGNEASSSLACSSVLICDCCCCVCGCCVCGCSICGCCNCGFKVATPPPACGCGGGTVEAALVRFFVETFPGIATITKNPWQHTFNANFLTRYECICLQEVMQGTGAAAGIRHICIRQPRQHCRRTSADGSWRATAA